MCPSGDLRALSWTGQGVSGCQHVSRGQLISCVHRAETAACRTEKLALSGPDESRAAATRAPTWPTPTATSPSSGTGRRRGATVHYPLVPKPRQDRAAALAGRARAITEEEDEATRPAIRRGGEAA